MTSKMPRNPHCPQVYIADGFADDCEELIHRCSHVDQLNYPTFCTYYKEMNFATVYQCRTTNAEIGELSEELLQIAKHYMVRDTSNFEESVAGLFMVYALLNLQPFPRFAALRIVQDDLPALARMERVARRDQRLDVLYVLAAVLVRGPAHFHADARPRGMETAFKKYLEGFCNIDVHGVRPKGVYSRQNEELDLLRDIGGIFERYSQAKAQIPGFQRTDDANRNLAVELGDSLKRVINGISEEEAGSSVPDHHDAVQEIKKRAMLNVVSTVRHLDSAEQRQKNTQSPKKSPKKRNSFSSSTGDEDDSDIESLAKDVMSQASFRELLKPKDTHKHIDIDSLPRTLTTESCGKTYEIEIIDEMNRPSLPIIHDDGKIEVEIIDHMKESDIANARNEGEMIEIEINEIKNQNDSPSGSAVEGDETKTADDKVEIPKKRARSSKKKTPKRDAKSREADLKQPPTRSPRLKRVLKRDQKKPILKSKFKRMGLLEVANFQEKK